MYIYYHIEIKRILWFLIRIKTKLGCDLYTKMLVFCSHLNFVNEKNELKDYAIQSVFSVENEFFLVGTLFCRFKIDDINVFMTDQKFNLIFTI